MNDDQFAQLTAAIQNLDKKFESRFDAMEKNFGNQFLKLFQYMKHRFQSVEDRLEKTALKEDVDRLTNAVDDFAKRMEIYDHEWLALGQQVDRHERWHHQTAEAVGLKLSA